MPGIRGPQRLQPLEQIEAAAAGMPLAWRATGNDPQFLVVGQLRLRGWHMLEVALDHEAAQQTAKLYWDLGNGFCEDASTSLPVAARRLTKRLFLLPRRARKLRFDPLEQPGHFSVIHFRIAWLPPFFAQDRLLRRLARHHASAESVRPKAIRRRLKQRARELGVPWRELALEQYAQTFPSAGQDAQSPPVYRAWLQHSKRCEPTPAKVQRVTAKLRCQPLVSVIVPTFDTHGEWLRACIESVVTQSYRHWQLCIADDASTRAETKELLMRYAAQDPRIEVAFRRRNGGVSAASNTALAMAHGRYVAFLDHDDLLAPNALYQVVRALSRCPDAQLIYSDEDKLDTAGERMAPHFKPDWNPDLALAQNYVNHLAVYSTQLLRDLGGLRVGVEGSQDHDLLLRATARLEDRQILHIPRILYHWRAAPDSVAASNTNKPETRAAGLKGLRDHLAAHAPGALASPGRLANSYRVHWPIPTPTPRVSILVPSRDRLELLRPCVEAILHRTAYASLELLVIDNGSRCDATLAYLDGLRRQPRVCVLRRPGPFNFSALVNAGAAAASGELLLVLNNDTFAPEPGWLHELVSHACRPEIGCVGAKLLYPDERVQHAGVILGIGGVAGHAHKQLPRQATGYFGRLQLVHNVAAVTAACLMVRRAVFDAVGGFDAEHLPVSFNDVDFCLRVREAGYRNLWTPYAELYHHESASRGDDAAPPQRARFITELNWMRKRWGRRLQRDPAYNPNLTLQHEDFSLR